MSGQTPRTDALIQRLHREAMSATSPLHDDYLIEELSAHARRLERDLSEAVAALKEARQDADKYRQLWEQELTKRTGWSQHMRERTPL